MNGLDLFSGIGGITLALSEWVRSIAYCENDRYAQAVLLSRMDDGYLPKAPIWDDVRTLGRKQINVPVDIIYGGFPCQDISVAGKGVGITGERSGLFFEIIRLIDEFMPAFVFLENVPAIRTRGLDRVLQEFTQRRYDCRWTMLSAAEVGACHKRERWFMLANSNSTKLWEQSGWCSRKNRESKIQFTIHGEKEFMAYPECIRLSGSWKHVGQMHTEKIEIRKTNWVDHKCKTIQTNWNVEPDVGRVANGILFTMDRIKCLGNSVVPLQAREAFKRLMGN